MKAADLGASIRAARDRSEAAAILTGYGQSPGELDFDLFLRENPAVRNPQNINK